MYLTETGQLQFLDMLGTVSGTKYLEVYKLHNTYVGSLY